MTVQSEHHVDREVAYRFDDDDLTVQQHERVQVLAHSYRCPLGWVKVFKRQFDLPPGWVYVIIRRGGAAPPFHCGIDPDGRASS